MEDKGDLGMKRFLVIMGCVVAIFLLSAWWHYTRVITDVARRPVSFPDDMIGVIVVKSLGEGIFFEFDLDSWRVRPLRHDKEMKLERPKLISPDGKKELRRSPFPTRPEVYFREKGVTLTLPHEFSLNPITADWSPDSKYLVYVTALEDSPWVTQVYILELDTGWWWYVLTGKNLEDVWWVGDGLLTESDGSHQNCDSANL
ncbi:MAG: hypothetical protein ACM3VX_02085 [Bacteroidota bacterium]